MEVDTLLRAQHLAHIFEQLKETRGLPDVLHINNGSEFLGTVFTAWHWGNGIFIDYIEPGKPNQNAFIERFNRSVRNEALDLYLFRSLGQVRELVEQWRTQYNNQRSHDALGACHPAFMRKETRKTPVWNCQLDGGSLRLFVGE
jgi:putative transposase